MSDWRIHRREERCARCEHPFEEGEPIFSLLFIDADRLRREDHCPRCFQGPDSVAASAGQLIFWRTRHAHDKKARFAVDFEAIEELFLSLEGRREGRLQELRYLLSLLLLRKKRLKLVGVRRNPDGETLCVRRPRRAEEHEVQVFELDTERALALKAELAKVFEGAGVESLSTTPAPTSADSRGTTVAEAGTLESAP
jgi:hypothetical protein